MIAIPAALSVLWRPKLLLVGLALVLAATVFAKGRAWERGVWEAEMAAAQAQDAAENQSIERADAKRVKELIRTLQTLEHERDDLSEKLRRLPASDDACLDRPVGPGAVGLRP